MKTYFLLALVATLNIYASNNIACKINNKSTNNIDYQIFEADAKTPCALQVINLASGTILANQTLSIVMEKSEKPMCIVINNLVIRQFYQSEHCSITYQDKTITLGKLCKKIDV